jgi:hypothetical protein
MQDKVFFLSQVLLLLDVGAAPTAFCYQFKPTPDRLVLNYVMTPVVRSSFAVLLITARL